MSDNLHLRDGPVEMIGKKHLFDTEMGQVSLLPETIDSDTMEVCIAGDDELDTQNDREMFSVPDTSNSDFNPPPFLQHATGISSHMPSPYPTSSIDDSQDNARRESLTEAAPGSKTRKRKPKTKELSPEDTDNLHLINLGMSPFMPAQDAMTNQNRLVRNETILARHVFRIQKSQTVSDSTHAQRVQDVYRALADHKVFIESLQPSTSTSTSQPPSAPGLGAAGTSTSTIPSSTWSIRSNPDFMELLEEQRETRKILDELNDEMARFSAFTRRVIDGLTEAIQRLSTQHAATEQNYPTTSSSRPSTGRSIASSSSSSVFSTSSNNESSSTSSLMNSNRTLPPLSTLNLKRPRTDSISSSIGSYSLHGGRTTTSSISTLHHMHGTGAYQNVVSTNSNSGGGVHNTHFPRINLVPTRDDPSSSREVLYGSVQLLDSGNASGSFSNNVYHGTNVSAIADDDHHAVQNIGLSPSIVQSGARVAHGHPDHVDMRFWKART